jgi:hypothetical protein
MKRLMKPAEKAIYINAGIASALLLNLYWGRPPIAVGITALVLFPFANFLIYLSAKRKQKGSGPDYSA